MTKLLIVVAKVVSDTLSATHISFSKNINVFVIFYDRNFNITLANNLVNWTTGFRLFQIALISDTSVALTVI